jgi:hypothetical protein
VLREAYDAVIKEMDSARSTQQLTNAFYSKVGDSIFEACYRALEDRHAAEETLGYPRRLHVVSAPMGAGKTSFTVAFITALVRLGERDPTAPRGVVFLVEQMAKAEEMYRELSALLPGKVAVWTTDHNVDCAQPTKVLNPSARFHVNDLERHEVAIVTHAFVKGKRGHKARYVLEGGNRVPRVLTIIDEQSDDVTIYDVTLKAATAVLEAVQQDEQKGRAVAPHIHTLVKFMTPKADGGSSLEKPSDDPTGWSIADDLYWFVTRDAAEYAKEYEARAPGLRAVVGFAKALASGYAFIARYGSDAPHFVGYENTVELRPGTVLLDATADIDGITPLCRWRSAVQVPQASYRNLDIVHLPSCTKRKLGAFFEHAKNRLAYVDWMKATILDHSTPGQRVLVVCKKDLFVNRNVPDWPERDPRFDTPDLYLLEYGWELDDRKLCATHWGGYGIGVNAWKDADVVFLFDEYHVPRRVTIARAQGLISAKATEGLLRHMRTTNSKSQHVDAMHEGHLLRWTKQMALRGKGRHFDEHGVCGQQKVVCTGDYERLLANADRLFPGAKITKIGDASSTKADRLIALLSRPELPDVVTTKWIGEELGEPWGSWSKDVLKRTTTRSALKALGWRYEPVRGRGGRSRFVRETGVVTLKVDQGIGVGRVEQALAA